MTSIGVFPIFAAAPAGDNAASRASLSAWLQEHKDEHPRKHHVLDPWRPSSTPARSTARPVAGRVSQVRCSRHADPTPQPPAGTPPAAPGAGPVDIAVVLDKLAGEAGQKLDWRKSIVDLMKLLKLDSSFDARKKLAQELRFAGDTKDSAAMNVWLHRQVMRKLAENGGKVPADLKH